MDTYGTPDVSLQGSIDVFRIPHATRSEMEPLVFGGGRKSGWIEVICGSMFSGKTEELIRRLKRARFARQKIEIFKPAFDTRYDEAAVVSHDENMISSTPVDTASQILLLAGNADVVGIDEAQFFNNDLVDVCQQLARDGKRVIVVGLDQDYLGKPFEPLPQLMAVAEHVTKLHAVCVVCGAPANHSQRIVVDSHRVLLGARDSYEPRCRRCFKPGSTTSSQPAEAVNPESLPAPFQPAPRTVHNDTVSPEGQEAIHNAHPGSGPDLIG